MTQVWTITSLDGATVLCERFETSSSDVHPKDAGWAWDASAQAAWPIDAPPNTLVDRWNGSAWVYDVEACRQRKWLAIRAARDAAQSAGCVSALGRVDTDPESRGKISGAVQMAMIAQAVGQPFSIAWTMQDNSVVAHDATAMIAMGVAVGQHIEACHYEGTIRRAAIEGAQSAEDIEAVPVEGGWPGA